MRSTSSMTSMAGWRARATEHASAMYCIALPVTWTTVVPVRLLIRNRTVWVLPTPGGP
jgi:hypothetical protein